MKRLLIVSIVAAVIAAWSLAASADDIEGQITSINPDEQSFVVQGITFFATPTTDYDDGLRRFSDLQLGQKVEVDFVFRDGRHIATEIELED